MGFFLGGFLHQDGRPLVGVEIRAYLYNMQDGSLKLPGYRCVSNSNGYWRIPVLEDKSYLVYLGLPTGASTRTMIPMKTGAGEWHDS